MKRIATLLLAILGLAVGAAAQGPPGGGPPIPPLPPMPVPPQNPLNPAKAVLGKMLFWEEQLSSDNRVACGTCHLPELGGGDDRIGLHPGPDGVAGTADDKRGSPGVARSDASNHYLSDPIFGLSVQVTDRTAPTMINAGFSPTQFWDGRAEGPFTHPETGAPLIPFGGALEIQAAGPPLSDVEMAHDARMWSQINAKLPVITPMKLATNLPPDMAAALAANPTYPQLFQAAFGTPMIDSARIAMAIASYERTLVADQTPLDQLIATGNPMVLTPQQNMGLNIFRGPGQCNTCHTLPQASDHTFRNVGLRPVSEDEGRFNVTGNPMDRGRFKVPSLRNVALRPRFMHNGQFTTLQQVVDFYAGNGDFNFNKDPIMNAIGLPPGPPRADLVAFLIGALTDPRVAAGLPPFDRPTLGSEQPATQNPIIGFGTPGSSGFAPAMLAGVPANIGSPEFKVGVAGVPGGTTALLAFSANPPLPPGSNFMGVSLVVDAFDPGLLIFPTTANGTGLFDGIATVVAPIPNLPLLTGLNFVGQWFVFDTGSPAAVDFSSSPGALFTLF